MLIGVDDVPKPMMADNKDISPKALIEFAETHWGLPGGHFKRKADRRKLTNSIKHAVRAYMHFNYNISSIEIGRITHRADHSTVLHSFQRHHEYMKVDYEYRDMYTEFSRAARDAGFREEVSHA